MDYTVLEEFGKFFTVHHDGISMFSIGGDAVKSVDDLIEEYEPEVPPIIAHRSFQQSLGRLMSGELNRDKCPFFTDNVPRKIQVMARAFRWQCAETVVPIKSNFILGDGELGVAGSIDQILWNKKSNELQIWTWVPNNTMSSKSEMKFIEPLSHIDYCEFNIYSLRSSIKKLLLEKNTNLKIGGCYTVWLQENNEAYVIAKDVDFENEINSILGGGEQKEEKKLDMFG